MVLLLLTASHTDWIRDPFNEYILCVLEIDSVVELACHDCVGKVWSKSESIYRRYLIQVWAWVDSGKLNVEILRISGHAIDVTDCTLSY